MERANRSITIRRAIASEAADLSALAKAAKSHWGYAPEVLESWRDALTLTPHQIHSAPTFVAEVDGTPLGFYQINVEARCAELEHLWVRPHAMGRGIGRALIRHAMMEAADRGADRLHIDADPNATAFYVACGARQVGQVRAPIPGQPERVRHTLSIDLRS